MLDLLFFFLILIYVFVMFYKMLCLRCFLRVFVSIYLCKIIEELIRNENIGMIFVCVY